MAFKLNYNISALVESKSFIKSVYKNYHSGYQTIKVLYNSGIREFKTSDLIYLLIF